MDRHKVALETLGESVETLRVTHAHMTDELAAGKRRVADAESRLTAAKEKAAKDLATAKAEIAERRRTVLVPIQETHRRISALHDEIKTRVARVKDTLA
jgi:predicted  nucleic acid-binding Zn-ribbon protein